MEHNRPAGTGDGDGAAIPVHEQAALYDHWIKYILAAILALTLIPGLWFFSTEPDTGWVLLGCTLFDTLLFHAILPRRFQVFGSRLRIVLGWPFAMNIRLDTVREVRAADSWLAFAYWGIRFATSTRSMVEIVRNRGLNVVISPADREAFITQMSQLLPSGQEQ